jgi:hypothetical protein
MGFGNLFNNENHESFHLCFVAKHHIQVWKRCKTTTYMH